MNRFVEKKWAKALNRPFFKGGVQRADKSKERRLASRKPEQRPAKPARRPWRRPLSERQGGAPGRRREVGRVWASLEAQVSATSKGRASPQLLGQGPWLRALCQEGTAAGGRPVCHTVLARGTEPAYPRPPWPQSSSAGKGEATQDLHVWPPWPPGTRSRAWLTRSGGAAYVPGVAGTGCRSQELPERWSWGC